MPGLPAAPRAECVVPVMPALSTPLRCKEKRVSQANVYAPPQAELSNRQNETQVIDALTVSDGWKRTFHLLVKAGGPRLPNLQALSGGERFKVSFNILGFLFGPFYYLAKGMWKKALSLFAACLAVLIPLSLTLEYFGLDALANALGYGAAAVFAVRANIDYYKKACLDDNSWW